MIKSGLQPHSNVKLDTILLSVGAKYINLFCKPHILVAQLFANEYHFEVPGLLLFFNHCGLSEWQDRCSKLTSAPVTSEAVGAIPGQIHSSCDREGDSLRQCRFPPGFLNSKSIESHDNMAKELKPILGLSKPILGLSKHEDKQKTHL
jgi:hypothetical protein